MKKKVKSLVALILTAVMLLSVFCIVPITVNAAEDAWYVAGVSDLCNGEHWVPGAEINKMTFNPETGLFEITFEQVGEDASESNPFAFEFKVTSATLPDWSDGVTFPDENVKGAISACDDVKVTFNPKTGEVNWYSDSAFVITWHTYRVAGSADLCGTSWNPTDDNNRMTYNEETGRYEKVYTDVEAEAISGYEYKITVDGSSWIPGGMSSNPTVFVEEDGSTVTIWYDEVTGEFGADVVAPETETEIETETSTLKPSGSVTDTKKIPVKTGDIVEYTMSIQNDTDNEGLQFKVSYGSKLRPTAECEAARPETLMPNFTVGVSFINFHPTKYDNTILGSNMNVKWPYNDFKIAKAVVNLTFEAVEDGEAEIYSEIMEIYDLSDNDIRSSTNMTIDINVIGSIIPTDPETETETETETEIETETETETKTETETETETDVPTEIPTDKPTEPSQTPSFSGGKIYWQCPWENVSIAYCHVWGSDGTMLYGWQTKREIMTDEGNGIWSYEIPTGAFDLIVFSVRIPNTILSGANGSDSTIMSSLSYTSYQTYDLVLTDDNIGDTANTDVNEIVQNPMDSSKKASLTTWNSGINGPHLALLSSGEIVGNTLCPTENGSEIVSQFIADNIDNPEVITKDILDNAISAFGTSNSEIVAELESNEQFTQLEQVKEILEYTEIIIGDVTGDGTVTISDAIMLQKHIANIIVIDGDLMNAADVTKDGVISISDAIMLQKHIANIIKLV